MPNLDLGICGRPAVRQHGRRHRIGLGFRDVRYVPGPLAGLPCASFWIAFAASGCPGPTGRLDLRRGERHGRTHRGTGCGESLTSRPGERFRTARTDELTPPVPGCPFRPRLSGRLKQRLAEPTAPAAPTCSSARGILALAVVAVGDGELARDIISGRHGEQCRTLCWRLYAPKGRVIVLVRVGK
jgi:hypothetical protein